MLDSAEIDTMAPPRAGAAERLAVRTLTLTDFRNYPHLRIEPDGACVVLVGHNGAGKTNLLEAVSFLAPGRGMRRARLSDIDRRGDAAGAWVVAASVHNQDGDITIGTGRDAQDENVDKRLVRIDGKAAKSHTELARYMSLVWLTPQMDQLFLEGQTARRKFLDRLVYGFDAEHASRVNAYEYAMRERNRLLSEYRADPAWLDVLEAKMAEVGTAIAIARLETAEHLNQVMEHSTLSFPRAILSLKGLVEEGIVHGHSALEMEGRLRESLAAKRREDAAAGRSLIGAHRSELTVIHAAKNMEAEFCSTGEQKALLLAMVLSEARSGARWHGKIPVMLLDEVVAHLDVKKRHELYEEIQDIGAQAWMTGTDASLFEGMRDRVRCFRVENATVEPIK